MWSERNLAAARRRSGGPSNGSGRRGGDEGFAAGLMLLGPQRVRIGEEHAGMLASIERTAAVLEKVRRAPTSFARGTAWCRAFAVGSTSIWLSLSSVCCWAVCTQAGGEISASAALQPPLIGWSAPPHPPQVRTRVTHLRDSRVEAECRLLWFGGRVGERRCGWARSIAWSS